MHSMSSGSRSALDLNATAVLYEDPICYSPMILLDSCIFFVFPSAETTFVNRVSIFRDWNIVLFVTVGD